MNNNEFAKGEKFTFAGSIAYADKAVVSKHILKNETGNISLFAFDAGEGLSEHTAPFDAMVYVVEGKVEIVIGGIVHLLEGGETIIMPAGVPHALNAVARFKMVLTMIKNRSQNP